MMNTLEAIQSSFHVLTPFHARKKLSVGHKTTICFCNSDGAASNEESSQQADGDKRKQELLARIAMLQAQKVRLTEFLDERSEYLSQVAEEANTEFDQIGESALKELEDASARIMEKLEKQSMAFEESAEINRQEIEKNEKILEEFEDQMERDLNENLFFKNLGTKAPKKPNEQVRKEAMLEAQKLKEATDKNLGSKARKNIYLALMSILAFSIGNAVLATSEVEWRKVAALALIFFGLLAQFIYENGLSSESDETTEKKEK